MTNAQHLIENAIFGVKEGRKTEDVMQDYGNQMMLKETGITSDEVAEIVDHVVFGLYKGEYPEGW